MIICFGACPVYCRMFNSKQSWPLFARASPPSLASYANSQCHHVLMAADISRYPWKQVKKNLFLLRTAGLRGSRDVGESERPGFCEEPHAVRAIVVLQGSETDAVPELAAQSRSHWKVSAGCQATLWQTLLCSAFWASERMKGEKTWTLGRGEPWWGPNLPFLPACPRWGSVASLKPKRGAGSPRHVCCFSILSAAPETKLTKWYEQISGTTTGHMVWEDSLFISYVLWIFFFFPDAFQRAFLQASILYCSACTPRKDKYFQCVSWGMCSHWENVSLMDIAILTSLAG